MILDLNKKQKEAVESADGPLIIVAGAGSGKTKTLTSRLAYLIASGKTEPEKILAITFTNKAADEMKSRVYKILSKGIKRKNIYRKILAKPFVGTFHSFGAKVLRENHKHFNRTENFSIYDRNDSLSIIKKIIKNESQKFAAPAILKEISRIKSELLNKRKFVKTEKDKFLWKIYLKYEKELESSNAFDFDDLIEKVVRLFEKNRDILEVYRKRYKYILVDEYQDINTAQYKLIKLLAEEHGNINVVGDDQQSIYKFRFSDFRNFLNFEKDWPNARTVILEQNYRSTKNIVLAASALISNNKFQKPKKLWTDNPIGEPIYIVEHEDEFGEADFITDKAVEYLRKHKNVGILFRTNAQSRALEHILVEKNIEYNIYGAVSFYERKEIKDIIAILKIAHNPRDNVSISRIEKVFYKRKTRELVDKIMEIKNKLPADIINFVLKSTNYIEILEKNYLNYDERIENIAELIYFASQFKTLSEFLENVSLASPLDWNKKERRKRKRLEGINLMTIHLAKGLEFDVVMIAGANEGLLPHQRSIFSEEDLEEERRLMYVAITRAKEVVYLNYYDIPSSFLSEIPGTLVKFYRFQENYFKDHTHKDNEDIIEYD